jgi:hypothetical protein|tara:strand:+ start:2419 stop:2601 length:183 start_codon:yes stop_codon:yes gene_type:complete
MPKIKSKTPIFNFLRLFINRTKDSSLQNLAIIKRRNEKKKTINSFFERQENWEKDLENED